MPSDKFRQKHPKNRQTKIHLVFDEENRREFLTGFHKRKEERKRVAREQQEQRYKEEKQKLRLEARQALQAGWKQLQFPDELETTEDTGPVVFDNADHTITIKTAGGITVETMDLLAAHGGIGENKVEYEDDNISKDNAQTCPRVLAACDGSGDDEGSDQDEDGAAKETENKDTTKKKRAKLLKLQRNLSKGKQGHKGGPHRHKGHGVKQRGKLQTRHGRGKRGGKQR